MSDDLSDGAKTGCGLIVALAALVLCGLEIWFAYRAVVALESVAYQLRRISVALEEKETKK